MNFCVQGESDLQSYPVKPEDSQKDVVEKHVAKLNKILPQKPNVGYQNVPLLRPVPLMRPV